MKYVDPEKIIKGIGSILPQNKNYDRPSRALKALDDLAKNGPTLDFVSSGGWKNLMKEYQQQIKDLEANILYLSQDADKNKQKIQRASDFVRIFEIIIKSTNIIIANHLKAMEEYEKHNQTPITAVAI